MQISISNHKFNSIRLCCLAKCFVRRGFLTRLTRDFITRLFHAPHKACEHQEESSPSLPVMLRPLVVRPIRYFPWTEEAALVVMRPARIRDTFNNWFTAVHYSSTMTNDFASCQLSQKQWARVCVCVQSKTFSNKCLQTIKKQSKSYCDQEIIQQPTELQTWPEADF